MMSRAGPAWGSMNAAKQWSGPPKLHQLPGSKLMGLLALMEAFTLSHFAGYCYEMRVGSEGHVRPALYCYDI